MSQPIPVSGVPARARLAAGTAGRPVWAAAYAPLLLAMDAVAITVAPAAAPVPPAVLWSVALGLLGFAGLITARSCAYEFDTLV